jgi:hypothetical protein
VNVSVLYRIGSVLLLLFAVGHTIGFRRVEPQWGVDAAIGALKATRFTVQGLSRTYWGFYTGFGLFVTVLLLLSAGLAWQLGGLPRDTLKAMPVVTWGLAVCYVVVTYLSWHYFFIAPGVFSGLIAVCFAAAAWSLAGS